MDWSCWIVPPLSILIKIRNNRPNHDLQLVRLSYFTRLLIPITHSWTPMKVQVSLFVRVLTSHNLTCRISFRWAETVARSARDASASIINHAQHHWAVSTEHVDDPHTVLSMISDWCWGTTRCARLADLEADSESDSAQARAARCSSLVTNGHVWQQLTSTMRKQSKFSNGQGSPEISDSRAEIV